MCRGRTTDGRSFGRSVGRSVGQSAVGAVSVLEGRKGEKEEEKNAEEEVQNSRCAVPAEREEYITAPGCWLCARSSKLVLWPGSCLVAPKEEIDRTTSTSTRRSGSRARLHEEQSVRREGSPSLSLYPRSCTFCLCLSLSLYLYLSFSRALRSPGGPAAEKTSRDDDAWKFNNRKKRSVLPREAQCPTGRAWTISRKVRTAGAKGA